MLFMALYSLFLFGDLKKKTIQHVCFFKELHTTFAFSTFCVVV